MEVLLRDGVWFIANNNMNVLRNQVFGSQQEAEGMLERIRQQKKKEEDKDNPDVE